MGLKWYIENTNWWKAIIYTAIFILVTNLLGIFDFSFMVENRTSFVVIESIKFLIVLTIIVFTNIGNVWK